MANRLVTFGDPGPAGPPGTTSLPAGRGLLGHDDQAFFNVPIDMPNADPWYRQVLRLQVGGALGWESIPALPMPIGGPAKTAAQGKLLTFDAALGYVLTSPPAAFPSGADGLLGVDASGAPEVYPFGLAPDGSFARKAGTTITFSQLFAQNGYVRALSDGTFVYNALGTTIKEVANVLDVRVQPGSGLVQDIDGLYVDTSVIIPYAAGKLPSAAARGKSLIARYEQKSSGSTTVSTTGTYTVLASLALGALQIGDEVVINFQCNASGTGTQHIVRTRVGNSATADLALTAGATTRSQCLEWYENVAGSLHSWQHRHTVSVAEQEWVHVIARYGGATWLISDRELFVEVYRT